MSQYGRMNFAYKAADNPSFTLAEGESFEILSPDDGNGWTKIRNSSGSVGYAPSNYFSSISASTYAAENGGDDNVYEEINYGDVKAAPVAAGSDDHVEVLFDYAAQDGSISVKAGETLALLDKSNHEWWKVETPAKTQGFVPANYVKICDTLYEVVPSAPKMPSLGGMKSFRGREQASMKGSIAAATKTAAPKAPGARMSDPGVTASGNLLGMSPTERRRREMELAKSATKRQVSDPLAPVSEAPSARPAAPTPVYSEPPMMSSNVGGSMYTDDGGDSADIEAETASLRDQLRQAEATLRDLESERKKLAADVARGNSNDSTSELSSLMSKITQIQKASAI